MKLLQQYSRINLAASILIFLLASIAFYFSLHYVLLKQVDEDLKTEKKEIDSSVKKYGKLPDIIPLSDEITTYEPAKFYSKKVELNTIKMREENEDGAFRQIIFSIMIGEQSYKVSVAKSLENTDAITKSVILISSVSVFIFILAGFIINRILLKRLWMPFYKSMAIMKEYRIGQNNYPVFDKTEIEEFATLNETLHNTILNSENEYKNLKDFTENASHEMQTPVAVIRSKLDVLIQDENLSESQSTIIQGAYDAIKKLARLNHALLLLTKIENRQYSQKDKIQLDQIVEDKILFFNEILQNKGIQISSEIKPVQVNMNALLADILLNNLISNCIKHSTGGNVFISLTPSRLIVSNGYFEKALDGESIFKRFHKGGNSNDEHGLGLAIVKEICVVTGFKIEYSFAKNMHSFNVLLN